MHISFGELKFPKVYKSRTVALVLTTGADYIAYKLYAAVLASTSFTGVFSVLL